MKTYGKIFVFAIIGILLSMSLVPGQVAAGDIEVIITQEDDLECVTVTFEGGDYGKEVGQPEGSGMNFEYHWCTVTAGPYENPPSGITVAMSWGNSHSAVIEFDKLAGESVDLIVNDKKFAEGEVVVIDEHFGIRITNLIKTTTINMAARIERIFFIFFVLIVIKLTFNVI